MENFLTPKEVLSLKHEHKKCRDKRFAYRINAILLLNSGFSFQEVADLLLMDDETVRNYLKRYKEEGLPALMRDNYLGSKPWLTREEITALEKYLEDHVCLSAKEAADFVWREFGLDYSESGMTAVLHRLGYVYKKPKIIPGKANPEEQKKFVQKYRRIKGSKAKEDQIYFADGCHPTLNPIAGYGWIKKGTDKEIPSNTGRQHLNLNGAYNPETGEAIIIESEMINAQSTIKLFDKIQRLQPFGKIYFISDNARYYRATMIKEYLKEHERIKVIPLPSYSPNLNLIERLWHFYKKTILYNEYYETLSEMRETTLKFFKQLKYYRPELATLMTDNFHIIYPEFSKINLR